ncbi:hypothetical protein BDZ97DRAFT_2059570 [Flammula alnicola]|nr:hypothetical protein BDZ97DRAFT_2059570 [Flammula alnicola]
MSTYINASCQCELNSFRVAFDSASLPIPDVLCHCSTCRHSSGQMAAYYVSIKGVPLTRLHESGSRSVSRSGEQSSDENGRGGLDNGNGRSMVTNDGLLAAPSIWLEEPEIPYELEDLTTYKTSPDVTRYFCSSCSAQLFWVQHKGSENCWEVAVVKGRGWGDIAEISGGKGSEELPLGWRAQPPPKLQAASEEDKSEEQLQGFCHCGTIKFAITRPSEASFLPSSAYPDLLYPYDVSHLAKISNLADEKWWLRPASSPNPTKYLAGHCMCSFCRLCSGFEIQSWAYVTIANVVQPHTNTPLCLENENERPAGLKQYISSPGRYREFCGTCGATAFSWQAGVPDLVNVSVGLLDEKSGGVRAEDWLAWHKARMSLKSSVCILASRSLLTGLSSPLDHHGKRHVSGQMAFYYLPIRGPPLIGSLRPHLVDPNSTDLTGYRTSPNAVRYFCDGCSAHMFLYENDTNWYVAGGALERTAGIAQLGCHVHVEDTMDGGIADQLRAVGGKRLPRYANEENGKEVPLGWRANELKSREAAKQEEKLPFYCHCGAIKFDITRPNELSAQPYAPYPDLLFPTIQTRLATICNPKDEKWWLSPSMCTNETGQLITLDSRGAEEHKVAPSCGTKYLAGHCVCTHCRLGNGFEVQSWGFVPRSNIFEKGSSQPIEFMNEKLVRAGSSSSARALASTRSSAGRVAQRLSGGIRGVKT